MRIGGRIILTLKASGQLLTGFTTDFEMRLVSAAGSGKREYIFRIKTILSYLKLKSEIIQITFWPYII